MKNLKGNRRALYWARRLGIETKNDDFWNGYGYEITARWVTDEEWKKIQEAMAKHPPAKKINRWTILQKKHCKKFADYFSKKTGEKLTAEDVHRVLEENKNTNGTAYKAFKEFYFFGIDDAVILFKRMLGASYRHNHTNYDNLLQTFKSYGISGEEAREMARAEKEVI